MGTRPYLKRYPGTLVIRCLGRQTGFRTPCNEVWPLGLLPTLAPQFYQRLQLRQLIQILRSTGRFLCLDETW